MRVRTYYDSSTEPYVQNHPWIKEESCIYGLEWSSTWASADFSPGEGKIFQGEGQDYLPKNAEKHTSFNQKSRKHTILAGQGGGEASAPSCPTLRTIMK